MTRKEPPLRFVLTTLLILLIVAIVNSMFSLGSIPFALTILAIYTAYFVYGIRHKDHTIWLWLLFGFVTGLVEVASDCDYFLVEEMKVLVYPYDVPKIGVSPAYLPFAWGLIFTILGLLGEWIRLRRSLLVSSLAVALTGGAVISIFENLARQAGWWYYQDTPMLVWAPYFVNVFEFLSTLLIVPAGWRITRASVERAYVWALGMGAVMGIWMCLAMRISFWLLGPCEGAAIQLPCIPVSLPPVWQGQ